MRELADEEMDEAQRTELSEELASVLLAEHPSAGALETLSAAAANPRPAPPDPQTCC